MSDFVEDRSILSAVAEPPDTVVRYGELEEHIAEVRYGQNGSHLPLVILIHGGFWRPSIDRTHAGPMSSAIAETGWTIATIEYRRIPGKPNAATADVALAIKRLPELVAQHGANVIAVGHSAGGHLALWAAYHEPILRGVLALGPVADLAYADQHALGSGAVRAFLGCSAAERTDLDPCRLASPSADVTLLHGSEDAIAPIAMSERYHAAHRKSQLVKLDRCGHFAVIDPKSSAWPRVLSELRLLS